MCAHERECVNGAIHLACKQSKTDKEVRMSLTVLHYYATASSNQEIYHLTSILQLELLHQIRDKSFVTFNFQLQWISFPANGNLKKKKIFPPRGHIFIVRFAPSLRIYACLRHAIRSLRFALRNIWTSRLTLGLIFFTFIQVWFL